MKIATMRRLDAWVGVPLCWLATGVAKLQRLADPRPTEPGKRLLVIKLSEQGANIILGEPMRRLQRTFARQDVFFLAFEESRSILKVMDFVPVDNLITIRTSGLGHFASDVWAAFKRIRDLRVDTCLDLEFFSRASALLTWASGARRRVGVHNYFGEGAYRGELMTHGVKFNPHLHISQMFLSMAHAALQPDGELQRIEFAPHPATAILDRFVPTEDENQAVDRLLAAMGWQPGQPIVLLNSNISDRELIPLRKWDENNYAEVGRRVLAKFPNVRVLLTGSPGEAESVAELERTVGSDRCRSVAGKTSLRELFTLYTRATLMVTNDSGPAHFATLTDMHVVVLFGPESPQLWRPLSPRVHVVYRGLACSPCFSIYNGRQSGCRRNACMDMTPDEVFQVVRGVLQTATA